MADLTFRQRIRTSIANSTLQSALDANAERRAKGRLTAMAELPDWHERRQRAHAIRADVIQNLEKYQEQFIRQARSNGITVHMAEDGRTAIDLILEITKSKTDNLYHTRLAAKNYTPKQQALQSKTLLVAKSKSMVSEEINLNHALESHGIRVVETDLGEYIVQLRGERPSHIITPAVHLRRQEVGQLFHEKLGIPYTEDIPTLTNTARKVLREVFLTADVGLSGVNFGVADSGTVCIITNEGNGRMVTTLPPIHIALMGMERLLPTLDDLALFLTLLPRSATGQKLTVYTQLLHKSLPGQQRHLILLDNGRSALRASSLAEALYCIRCGACLNACPVFREIGGHAYNSVYPGPIGSVISAGLFGSEFSPLAQASTLCGACKEACPVDIDLPKLLIQVRTGTPTQIAQPHEKRGKTNSLSILSKISLKIFTQIARRPWLFALGQRFASLPTVFLSRTNSWIRLPSFTGWGFSKDLPGFANPSFRSTWNRHQKVQRSTSQILATPANGTIPTEKPSLTTTPPIKFGEGFSSEEIRETGTLTKQFIDELMKVSGRAVRTTSSELSKVLLDLINKRSPSSVYIEPGILAQTELGRAGIQTNEIPDHTINIGVTRADCGLADTGSIIVTDAPGSSLQASLLPQIHVAVLQAKDILPSLADAVNQPWLRDAGTAVVITGPSRTGDIEMSHTIGVHGPGELYVMIVDG